MREGVEQDTTPSGRRSLLAPGEFRSLIASAGAYCALLAGYYMLRSLREAFALQVGRQNIDNLFYATFVVMMAILPVYWFVVARTPRRCLVPAVYTAVIALFAVLAAGKMAAPGSRALAAVYFVAVTSLNLFIVTVFWSTMVDAWNTGAAKRVFGFVAAGGSAGALLGPLFNSLFVERLGPSYVIFIACAVLGVAIVAAHFAQHSLLAARRDHGAALDVAVSGRAVDDLARLVRSPYLLAIAGLILAGQVLGAFMYNEQARYVEAAYATLNERAALFARVDLAVNILSLAFQTLVVGWLAARGGARLALSAVPLLLCASLAILALVPVGGMLLATQVVRRAVDYGLFKPTREMLFTVLNPESKFKSKSLIDTLLQRGGDSLGQALYGPMAGLGLAGVAWIGAALSLAMLGAAASIGGAYARQEQVTERGNDHSYRRRAQERSPAAPD
jgi:AAA family ATP:ADP antiporter